MLSYFREGHFFLIFKKFYLPSLMMIFIFEFFPTHTHFNSLTPAVKETAD